jgi:hypothetical protein
MTHRFRTWIVLGALLLVAGGGQAAPVESPGDLDLWPREVELRAPTGRQQLLATGTVDGRPSDLTRRLTWRSGDPDVVSVDADGVAHARGVGTSFLEATIGDRSARVAVKVGGSSEAPVPTLEREILPLLTRHGCNAGACHGKARGQNGFALSLLGFDPNFDFDAITREARGRRIFPPAPEQSLLLQKATARVPHGGGRRIEPDGPEYDALLRWIARGTPRTPADSPALERITVMPVERLMGFGGEQQLAVTAHYADGTSEDVTSLAAYQSSEGAVVGVDRLGRFKAGPIPGEAAITARFRGLFAGCEVMIPLPGDVPASLYADLPRANFIDDLVWKKLERLGITPSEPAGDSTFLRRAYLDVIGRVPNADETRSFLADTSQGKRARLVDALLERPDYADYWANKWMDLLRPNPYRVGIKAVWNLDAWVRDAFRRNMPYDQFVRAIVTARGSTFRNGPATLFRDRREPEEMTTMVSQVFLGIRLECARCHHHPFESWGQEQFFEFAAYFAQVGRKGTGLSPPISGGEEIVYHAKSGSVKHPLTGEQLAPRPLFGKAPAPGVDDPEGDPREILAAWMTGPENSYFARVIANRVWAELMGRGIVDPVDDLRATNPPSNGPLLEALAEDFRRHRFDLKHLIRTIMASTVYGLGSEPNERNLADTRNFSRHYRQRLRAEVLLDALSDISEVPERFEAAAPRSRATAIWTHRVPSLFLDTFGRPDPNQDPPCERTSDTSVVQALHLMNAPGLDEKLSSDSGLVARLARSDAPPRSIVEQLYLLAYSRLPTEEERSIGEAVFTEPEAGRRGAIADLLWALINSAEFVFKD